MTMMTMRVWQMRRWDIVDYSYLSHGAPVRSIVGRGVGFNVTNNLTEIARAFGHNVMRDHASMSNMMTFAFVRSDNDVRSDVHIVLIATPCGSYESRTEASVLF